MLFLLSDEQKVTDKKMKNNLHEKWELCFFILVQEAESLSESKLQGVSDGAATELITCHWPECFCTNGRKVLTHKKSWSYSEIVENMTNWRYWWHTAHGNNFETQGMSNRDKTAKKLEAFRQKKKMLMERWQMYIPSKNPAGFCSWKQSECQWSYWLLVARSQNS